MKVLVAIDAKPSSRATLDAMLKMQWQAGTEINLVTVLPKDENHSDDSAELSTTEAIAEELHNRLKQCKVAYFVRRGEPKEELLSLCENFQTDLMVVGSNQESTMERLILGSVTQSLVAAAPCPVLVAKTPCFLARMQTPSYKTILLPIDDSVYSQVAAEWLTNFKWHDSKLILLAVVEDDTDFHHVEVSLDNRAAALHGHFQPQNIQMQIVKGDPRQVIVDQAKKHYADMIVMGSHGRKGFKRMILGSVSQVVSQEAPCAVSIVRGLMDEDRSLKKTASFDKVKIMEKAEYLSMTNKNGDDLSSVHSMPAGF